MGNTVGKVVTVLEVWRLMAGKRRWTPGMVDAVEREMGP